FGYIFAFADGRGFIVDEEIGFAIGDGAEVLHGSGLQVRETGEVEIGHRVEDAEVIVVVVQDVFGGGQRECAELLLAGRAANANGNAVALAGDALEVADEEGDEIG